MAVSRCRDRGLRAWARICRVGLVYLGAALTPEPEPLPGASLVVVGSVPHRAASDLHRHRLASTGWTLAWSNWIARTAGGHRAPASSKQRQGWRSAGSGRVFPRTRSTRVRYAAECCSDSALTLTLTLTLRLGFRAMSSADRSRLPVGPVHRRHLRHGRGRAARLSAWASRVVQPRPGEAGDRARSRGAAARAAGGHRRRRSGVRAGARHLGAPARGRRALQPALPAGQAVAVHRAERVHLRRRARRRSPAPSRRSATSISGHFLPDYTAYEELLDIFKLFTAIPILLDPDRGYRFDVDELRREITGRGLSALLLSNPCNPTGQVIAGAELERVGGDRARARVLAPDRRVLLALHLERRRRGDIVSAARYVEDVNTDPVVLFDGFTKNWRYPGWRCTWTVGPEAVIEAVSSSGSFLDGGGSKPLQRSAVPLLSPDSRARRRRRSGGASAGSARCCSTGSRRRGCGSISSRRARSTAGRDVSGLPAGLNDGMSLFRAARDQVIASRGVLRRESGQAAERAPVALQELRAVQLRRGGGAVAEGCAHRNRARRRRHPADAPRQSRPLQPMT